MNKQQLLKIFIINQTFHWFILGIVVPVIALLQLEKGLNLFQIGISMAIHSGTVVILELPTGGLSDTIGRKQVYLLTSKLIIEETPPERKSDFISGFKLLPEVLSTSI